MHILVTGANGFIGRHLIERLVAEREQVRALVTSSAKAAWLESLGVEVIQGDIGDAYAVDRAADKCEIIFHLAAKTEAAGLLSHREVRLTNVQGTENVVRAALRAGVGRLVFCSSVAVYGRMTQNRLIDENTETAPDSPYGESKVLGERIVLSARQRERLPVVVARLSTVWGPGSTSWLGFFRSILSGQFRLIGAGRNCHHIADVSDVVEGLRLCASTKGMEGRTFILSGSEAVQLRSLVKMIGEEVGAPPLSTSLPSAPLHMYKMLDKIAVALIGRQLPRADRLAMFLGDRTFDIERAQQELGYVPRINTRETIRRMAEWYRAQSHLPPLS